MPRLSPRLARRRSCTSSSGSALASVGVELDEDELGHGQPELAAELAHHDLGHQRLAALARRRGTSARRCRGRRPRRCRAATRPRAGRARSAPPVPVAARPRRHRSGVDASRVRWFGRAGRACRVGTAETRVVDVGGPRNTSSSTGVVRPPALLATSSTPPRRVPPCPHSPARTASSATRPRRRPLAPPRPTPAVPAARPAALEGALGHRHGPAHARPRRLDREPRAALGQGRPRHHRRRPAVGGHRLRPGLRRPAPARRPHRRLRRPQAGLHHRPLGFAGGLGARRHRAHGRSCSSPRARCRAGSPPCSRPRRSR